MQIPQSFIVKIIGAFGKDGRVWLDTLESRLETVLNQWQLIVIAPVDNLSYNYVLHVEDSKGTPLTLKLGMPGIDFQNEIRTLEIYRGKGCVQLLKSDEQKGVMLLERLEPGIMLSEIDNESHLIQQFVHVWKAIRRPAPSNDPIPLIKDWFQGIQRYKDKHPQGGGPISQNLINYATECFQSVIDRSEGTELLHGDLHHENILYSDKRGWLAIDPKGVVGDRVFDLVSFLINHLHENERPKEILRFRVDTLCEALNLDPKKVLQAAVAMAALYACWGIEDEDPEWEKTIECLIWFIEFLKEK